MDTVSSTPKDQSDGVFEGIIEGAEFEGVGEEGDVTEEEEGMEFFALRTKTRDACHPFRQKDETVSIIIPSPGEVRMETMAENIDRIWYQEKNLLKSPLLKKELMRIILIHLLR